MSLFNLKSKKNTTANNTVSVIRTLCVSEGATMFNPETSAAYVGVESEHSVTDSVDSLVTGQFDAIVDNLRAPLSELNLSDVGIESAARAALVLGDIPGLSKKLRDSVGTESFSTDGLREYRAETILANGLSAEKTSAIDLIYPVVEVGANFAGTTIELTRIVQVSNTTHGSGVTEFKRRHLTDAYNDSSALNGDGNRLYPLVITGETEDSFVSSSLIPTTVVPGTTSRTAPLAIATNPVNLLGLASVSGAIGSANTYNDRIDEGGRISNLIFSFGAAPTGGDPDTRTGIAVSLATVNSSQFLRGAAVGSINEVGSNMDISALSINLESSAIASNSQVAELVALGYSRLTVSLRLNSKLELHTGTLSQTASGVTVTGLYTKTDSTNAVTDASVASIIGALVIDLVGFTPDVTMSSKTIRLDGTRIDDETFPFTFSTTAQVPLTYEQEVQKDDLGNMVEVLTQADATRRESQGVVKLIEDITLLHSTYGEASGPQNATDSMMPGLAYLAQPFIRSETLSIANIMDSLSSSSRADDISGSIVPLIADFIADACAATNYVENKRIYTKDQSAKANFAVLTSRQVGRYITISGEDKTLGALSDVCEKPELVTSGLKELQDTVIVVPVSTAEKGSYDVFGWGNTLRSPTIVYDVQLTDKGAKRFLQLQSFYTLTTNCPIAYKLVITGLSDALRTKNVFKTTDA